MYNGGRFPERELISLIPKDELKEKLNYGCSELTSGFLCFEHNYWPVADNVPTDYTIIDIGCCQGAQSYMFQNHKAYIGVQPTHHWDGYTPPLKFETANSTYYDMTLQELLKTELPKGYYIVSAVPGSDDAKDELWERVDNIAIIYPGEEPRVKGIAREKILADIEKYALRERKDYV